MLISFGQSTHLDATAAVIEAVSSARAGLAGQEPTLALVSSTVEYPAALIHRALRELLPKALIHGATSSLGVLHAGGISCGPKGAFGLLLFSGGAFASAGAPFGADPRAAAHKAAQRLSARGEPRMVLLTVSPGAEEEILAGLADALPGVPVYGGSAADHAIGGGWSVFSTESVYVHGFSLLACYGEEPLGGSLIGPYRPSSRRAVVTGAKGRDLLSLDQRPAAEVFNEWLGGELSDQVAAGGNILIQTALRPLAVLRDGSQGRFFSLSHPGRIGPNKEIVLFSRVAEGDSVCLMEGSAESLLGALPSLAARVARRLGGVTPQAGFLVYCAGCAGVVGASLDVALRGLSHELGDVPLLGLCTFGEQGFIPGLGNAHVNLSMVLVLFG
jgi:hypothetical protein